MIKTLKKFIACVLLCLSLIVGLYFVERALAPDNSTFSGFYEEPKDTIDVVFIGGSHSMAAFSPAQMWIENNFTSYNMYSWSQNPWTAYHYAIEAIREQDVSVLVVEAFSFAYNQSYLPAETSDETSNEFALSIPPSLNRIGLSLAIRQNQVIPLPLSKMIPFVRYHSRWSDIPPTEVYENLFVSNYSSNKGFGPVYTTEVFDNYNYSDIGTATTLEANSKEYLLKLIELCEKEGVELILTKTPYIMEAQDRGYLDEIAEICTENDVPFLNYLTEDLIEQINFDYNTDMAEHAHVNYLGASKISAHMGEYLQDNYRQEIMYSADTIERWNNESAIEQRDIDNYDIRLASTFNALSQVLAQKSNYITIITAHGDMTAADASEIMPALEALNIDTDIIKSENASEVYVYKNGEDIDVNSLSPYGIEVTVTQNSSHVVFTQEEHSRNREGFNVVVYDELNDEIIHSVSFATQHNYSYHTA